MRDDLVFRIFLAAVIAGVVVIRIRYQLEDLTSETPATRFESKLNVSMRLIGGFAAFVALFMYLVRPGWMVWSSMPMPAPLRWAGAVLGFASIPALLWVHRSLGRNFSGTLHLRQDQALVTDGPYMRVRHPMYTVIFAIIISFFLLSANWFIGATWLGIFAAVMISRIPAEERVMREKFGEQYVRYAACTGRFFPPIFRG